MPLTLCVFPGHFSVKWSSSIFSCLLYQPLTRPWFPARSGQEQKPLSHFAPIRTKSQVLHTNQRLLVCFSATHFSDATVWNWFAPSKNMCSSCPGTLCVLSCWVIPSLIVLEAHMTLSDSFSTGTTRMSEHLCFTIITCDIIIIGEIWSLPMHN